MMQRRPPMISSSLWSGQRSMTPLTMIGLLSLLIYFVYVVLFPLTQYGYAPRPFDMEQIAGGRHWIGLAWVLGLVVLYGLFVVGLAAVDRSALSRRTVLAFGVLFGLTLIWLYPVTATDLFQYVLRARVAVVHGANPMAVTPATFPDDPLLPFAGEWKSIVSPYGPAWELLAAAIARLGFVGAVSGALAYKVVACVAYLACLAVLDWSSRRGAQPGANVRGLMLFAWNPLVLLQGVGNGHNDMVMLAWMLLAMVAWQRRLGGAQASWLIASAAVVVAVLTKASAALMGLLLVVVVLRDQPDWRRRGTALVGMAAVGAALALLAYLPFWPPWQSIAGVVDELSNRYTYTVAAMVRLWFQEFLSPRVAWDVPRTTGQLLFLGVLAWSAVQLWRRRLDLPSAGFLAYLGYLVGGSSYRIWYPLWLVPLAALSLTPAACWRAILMSFTSEFSIVFFYYVWRWYWPGASWLQMHWLVVPWQFGVPLILPILLRQEGASPLRRGGRRDYSSPTGPEGCH